MPRHSPDTQASSSVQAFMSSHATPAAQLAPASRLASPPSEPPAPASEGDDPASGCTLIPCSKLHAVSDAATIPSTMCMRVVIIIRHCRHSRHRRSRGCDFGTPNQDRVANNRSSDTRTCTCHRLWTCTASLRGSRCPTGRERYRTLPASRDPGSTACRSPDRRSTQNR